MSVRVRYAPSPTGLQHIGGIRTALFNYFFARSHGGSFILRIEDTDRERFSPEALQDIYDSFDWLGIREDEGPRTGGDLGPYVQSQRVDLYKRHAADLVAAGGAYPCFCTSQRLEELRVQQASEKSRIQGYDRHCRSIDAAEAARRISAGEAHVIRLKVPLEGETSFDDLVLGTVSRKNSDVNPDPVILKSDGFPTYHLANVIDDHHMKISHILRAQEWIPSGPLHVLLYESFGWEPPKFAHLPMVMGQDGQKLSKRHGSTALSEFRKQGYLSEAIVNYVTLLGWSYDDKTEFFRREELEKLFDISRLQKSPAVFDYKKLQWFNGQYIRKMTDDNLVQAVLPSLQEAGLVADPPTAEQDKVLESAAPLIRERIGLLADSPETIGFALRNELNYDPQLLVPKGLDAEHTSGVLEAVEGKLDFVFAVGDEEAEQVFGELAEQLGRKLGQVMMPVRIAITGTKASPPLVASMRLIGREETEKRITRARAILKGTGE